MSWKKRFRWWYTADACFTFKRSPNCWNARKCWLIYSITWCWTWNVNVKHNKWSGSMTWSLYIKKVNETVYLYNYHGSSLISAINNCLEINEITVLTSRVVYTCLPMYHSNIQSISMNLHMGLEMTDCRKCYKTDKLAMYHE